MKTTKNYTERPKEDQVTTRQMFKIVIYAAMNHIYSSRDIETAWSFRLSHFFCTVFYFSCLCSIPYCSIIFTYASSSACNASPFAQKDRANIEIQNSITVLRILMIPYLYAFLSKSSRNPCAVKYPTRNPAVFAIRSSTSGSLPVNAWKISIKREVKNPMSIAFSQLSFFLWPYKINIRNP